MAAWLITGCDAQQGTDEAITDVPSTNALAVTAPGFLLSSRALDLDSLRVVVQLNGSEVPATRSGDSWIVSINVAPDTPFDLSIVWTDGDGLLLAELYSEQPAVQSDAQRTITSDQYVSSGDSEFDADDSLGNFDADDDGFSNLEEINAGTNPYDRNSPPSEPPVSVSLPRIALVDAPRIDGLYDEVWGQAQFRDTQGNRLSIDNLLGTVDTNTTRTDGNTEFEWAGMHDGTTLYLFIFGETATGQGAAAVGDSDILFHDDSVELFFDGNYSQGDSYDGVDDTSIIIALLDRDGNVSGRIAKGATDSQPVPAGIEYFNCLCSPVYTWEIAIPLASLNIDPAQPFGMEVQLNDDNDGGDRDSYWGWIQTRFSDATFFVPSVMAEISLR